MNNLAIIGTGIAGMSAFYFLKEKFDITFYEKNNYPGGHTNTLTIQEDGQPVYIDSAFMVYNEITYPNLTRFFNILGVKTKPTDMSFSVQHKPTGLDFCGTGYNGLFAQRRNIFSSPFWKLLLEIDLFNKEAIEVLESDRYFLYTVREYAAEKGYSRDFLDKFLIPMSSAVWSTEHELMLDFPIVTLVTFFKNHGFLGMSGHFQWRTVVEGSQRYRDKVLNGYENKIRLNCAAVKVSRQKNHVLVTDARGETCKYSKVIIACHANEALQMIDTPTSIESRLLSRFSYQKNRVTLHTDHSLMPVTKRAWSSWNYRINVDRAGKPFTTTIYDMNSLQGVSKKKHYFISVNDGGEIDPSHVLWEASYDHPIYNVASIRAQKDLGQLNKNGQIYFCGAYFKYGFHEDAFTSGLQAARAIVGEVPWD